MRRLTVTDMAEFLVELYVSGAAADGADRETRRARSAAVELTAEGRPVRILRSIFVPEDETCFLLVEADTAEAVQDSVARHDRQRGRLDFATPDQRRHRSTGGVGRRRHGPIAVRGRARGWRTSIAALCSRVWA